MSDRFHTRNAAINDEAILWVVRVGANPADAEREAFAQWRARSPAHEQAVLMAQALLADVGNTASAREHRQLVQVLGQGSLPAAAAAPRMSRRALLAGGLSAAALASLGGLGVLAGGDRWLAVQRTGVGERRAMTLPDGSRAWLNSDSELSLRFGAGQRGMLARAGELFADVADIATLGPFAVQVRGALLHARSAQFALRLFAHRAVLTVLAGMVELKTTAGSVQVGAGQQLAFTDEVIGQLGQVDAEALTAWVRGKLVFNQQAVATIAREVERYVHGRVMVVGPRLQQLRLSGVFELDDPGLLLRSVADVSGAELIRLPLLAVLR
ncbi:FecR domain-containing protein [Stenotrophomonas maltophilia]